MSETEADPGFYLDFEIGEAARLQGLRRVFDRLATIKALQFGTGEDEDGDDWIDDDDPAWEAMLDEPARRHYATAFDWSTEEGQVFQKLWAATAPARRDDPMFVQPGPWDFDAVIGAIYNGEYLLEAIDERGEGRARLRYEALAGPFGGTESLVQLVEGFGHRVTYDSWHQGPPPRPEPGWDFERAKALVEQGRGVE